MQDQPDLTQLAIAVRRANKAKRATKFARFKPLDYQREWFETDRPIRVLTLPNQTGKTTAGAIFTLSACLGHLPVAMGGNPPPRWPQGTLAGKKFMCAGESYEKITTETIWPKLQEYVSEDMIKRITKNGKYISTVEFVTGAVLAFRSYDQHWRKFEGGNFDGVWFDEPPPQDVFSATRRGQMATEGWCIITGTPLPGSSWMRDELIFAEQNLDCEECSGGDVAHDEIVKVQPLHGRVYVPQAIEMELNCREHHGGYLPHAEIQAYLESISDPAIRAARQHGIFVDSATLTFGYVNDRDNVVDDFDAPTSWPLVEVVDPSPKRGLHIKWYVCDPQDRWYNIYAERIPSDGGFRRMAQQVFAHRQKIGRHPDLALMDPRGGHHKQVGSDGIKDWFDQFRAHGITYVPAVAPSVDNARVQILHDWLKPVFDPSKGGEQVPRLRFCRRLRTMKKGPLWAYERFTWDPVLSPKKQYEQECKDFIDCDMYLALWVEKHNLTFQKYEDMDRPPMTGIAASYSSGPPVGVQRRPNPLRRTSLGRSYSGKHPEWVSRIRGSYS